MSQPDLADELLSRLTPPRPLSAEQIARIRANITDQPYRARRLAAIGALAIVLCATSALAMYGVSVLVRRQHVVPAPPPELSPAPRAPAHAQAAVAATPPVAPPAPAPIPPAKDRAIAETALGTESRILTAALEQLRKRHDPKAALATLDRYAAAFPRGALAAEAHAARIEALLAAGDKRTALVLLDAGAPTAELAVLRGELRVDAGRLDEAARDFGSALLGADDALEARALYGRAVCRIRLGDREGGRRDLDDYLRRFPRGKSAADARTTLERSR